MERGGCKAAPSHETFLGSRKRADVPIRICRVRQMASRSAGDAGRVRPTPSRSFLATSGLRSISPRHPEVAASSRPSKDARPPPLPLAPGAATSGPSPFEARRRRLAPQGDGLESSACRTLVQLPTRNSPRSAVERGDEIPNLGTGRFGETMLIRLLVCLGAEPHSPVARSDKSKGASAVVAFMCRHCFSLEHVEHMR
jgi:hypothetical protein